MINLPITYMKMNIFVEDKIFYFIGFILIEKLGIVIWILTGFLYKDSIVWFLEGQVYLKL